MAELIAADSLFLLRSISSTTTCISPPGRPWKSIVTGEEMMLNVFSSNLKPKISIKRKSIARALAVSFFPFLVWQGRIPDQKKIWCKNGHVFSTLRIICQWKSSSESLHLSLMTYNSLIKVTESFVLPMLINYMQHINILLYYRARRNATCKIIPKEWKTYQLSKPCMGLLLVPSISSEVFGFKHFARH